MGVGRLGGAWRVAGSRGKWLQSGESNCRVETVENCKSTAEKYIKATKQLKSVEWSQ